MKFLDKYNTVLASIRGSILGFIGQTYHKTILFTKNLRCMNITIILYLDDLYLCIMHVVLPSALTMFNILYILDYFLQGMEIIFRIGLAILLSGKEKLLQMDMENMLKVSVFLFIFYLVLVNVKFFLPSNILRHRCKFKYLCYNKARGI